MDYMKIGQKFISEVYKFINTVNTTQMIKNNLRYREIMFIDIKDDIVGYV